MMDIYQAIETRRTIRDFEDRAIENDTLEKILDAGLKAPTNDHMRSWEFIVVSDKNVRAAIIEKIPKTVSVRQIEGIFKSWGLDDKIQQSCYMDAIPKQYKMLYNAGALILPFFKQSSPLLKPKTLSDLNAIVSMWCCLENILLAAASEGIFGVTRIPLGNEAEHIREVVHYPENYVLPCYLALGYPLENATRVKQYEFRSKDRIHMNTW
jgi:nitroreductase